MSTATEIPARPIGGLVEPNPPVPLWAGPWRVWQNVKRYDYLVANFIQRDIRLKYRGSVLGYFWSLLEPLLLSAVFVVLFLILAHNPEHRYPLWVLLGVMTWGLFSRSVTASITSLTKHEGMIKQVYFPRELFAITTVGAQVVMTSLSLLVVVPFLIYFRIVPTWTLLMVPVGLALLAMLALGIGLGMACLNVVNRDVEHFFKFLMRAGMFISPVMWTLEMVPKNRRIIIDYIMLNPIATPITMIRNGLSGMPLGLSAAQVAYSITLCVAAFLAGAIIFKRYEAQVVKKL